MIKLNPSHWKWLLLSLIIFSFTSILRPGFFPMHDDLHPMRVLQMKACILDLQLPCRWSPDMGYGYGWPQFHYYPPLPYYIITLPHLFGLSILNSIKLGFIISIIGSAWGMYLLGKHFYNDKAGVLSALLYIYLPYRAVNLYARGALGESWAMMWFPFVWYFLDAYLRQGKRKHMLGLALSTAALMLSHLLSTMILAIFLVVWTIYRLWQLRDILRSRLIGLTISALLAIGLAAFYVLPASFEGQYAHLDTLLMGYFSYYNHFISIDQIFFNPHWGYGASETWAKEDLSFQLGIFQWSLALLALFLSLKTRKLAQIFPISLLTLGWLGYIFLIHPRSYFIWKHLEILQWLQFPWRILASAGLLVSLTAGSLVQKTAFKWPHLLLIIIPLIFINYSYMQPKSWQNITDATKFTGEEWTKQQTNSIHDYLPISAEFPPTQRAPRQPVFLTGQGTIANYRTGTDWQKFQLTVTQPGQLRLPLFYFPGWQVTSNRQSLDLTYDNQLGLITFPVQPGSYDIHVQLRNTPIRHLGNFLTLVSAGIIIYLSVPKSNNFIKLGKVT